ncbi:hypothetical protein [Williamsia sp.]|uniref:hypothetical protein n=1 Tax=Williamsia sp. TaxID=1872085 RepID=UPI001A2E33B9|nr:hypothetical protein [Williamsia sp.]MBJ7289403.1 hypothetical protein [Williamsia sp.]
MTTPLRTIGLGPVIDDASEITESTPDSAIVSVDVCAQLTGYTVSSLRKFREVRRGGPTSFVLGRVVRYKLGDVRDFVQRAYDESNVVTTTK